MAQKYSDTNSIISLLKTTLHFKSDYERYNLNKKIKKEDMSDITTQLAHLYTIATKSNNNVTIINNMYKEDKQEDNEELLKQIEELKKENKKLKEENNESRKIVQSSDEEDDKVSKKKYDKAIEQKNKYWTEICNKDNQIEKLKNEIKEIKEQYDIKEDSTPLDILNQDYSDEEDSGTDEEEDDEEIYSKMEQVQQKQIEEKEKQKIEEENKKTDREILILKKQELKQFNKQIKQIQSQMKDKDIDPAIKKNLGKQGKGLLKKIVLLEEVIDKMERDEEEHINSLIKLDK